MYIVWCLIKSCKLHPALIECSISELRRFGCRIFDIRRTADRMSKIRHPKKDASDVEYSTFDGQLIECLKSDIRRRALRMSNIRHSTMLPIESKKSDPTNKANQIEFATFDPTECTRLVSTFKNTVIQNDKHNFESNFIKFKIANPI